MNYTYDELYHWGIKGQKWGVRRYQNKDGSLTPAGKKRLAKELKRDYKRNYSSSQPYRTSDTYKKKVKNEVNKVITDDDKRRIKDALDTFKTARKSTENARNELHKLATKYAEESYRQEMSTNGDKYDSPALRGKLKEFYEIEVGYPKAEKERPDLVSTIAEADKTWYGYKNECAKVADKVLDNYGGTTLYSDKYGNRLTIRETVNDAVMSLDSNDW